MTVKNYKTISAFMRDFIATNGKNIPEKHYGLCANIGRCVSSPFYEEEREKFDEFLGDTYTSVAFPIEGDSAKYNTGHKYRGKRLELRLRLAQRYLNWVKASMDRRDRIVKFRPGE